MALTVIYGEFGFNETTSTNVAVVIFLNTRPSIEPIVYDTTGVEDVDGAVMQSIKELTYGCNWKYDFVKKIGNVYFFE